MPYTQTENYADGVYNHTMQILLRLYNDVQKEKIYKYYYYFKVLTTTINAPSIPLIKTPP